MTVMSVDVIGSIAVKTPFNLIVHTKGFEIHVIGEC